RGVRSRGRRLLHRRDGRGVTAPRPRPRRSMATLLEQLDKMTVTVADTGDLKSIEKFRPRDATTNPSLITAAAQMKEYQEVVDEALRWARWRAGSGGSAADVGRLLIDRPPVAVGQRLL